MAAAASHANSLPSEHDLEAAQLDAAAQDGGLEQPLMCRLHDETDEHEHYSQRAPWLRAAVLGANDGLVSVSSLMMGVGGGTTNLHTLVLSGIAGLVGGALSMAAGEYISVSSQRDAEEADIAKEREQQAKGPSARLGELEELTQIYIGRGLTRDLARQVAIQLSEKDVIAAHARDELGIDMEEMANPLQACVTSAISFSLGAAVPLLAAMFIKDYVVRLWCVLAASTVGLAVFGAVGAVLGGASALKGALRVMAGGLLAMGITYAVGKLFGAEGV